MHARRYGLHDDPERRRQQPGLVHGKLHDHGEHCAIGSYFDINDGTSLPEPLIDEVAAVNDSVPHLSNLQRRAHVRRWLRWKLASLGMPGFSRWKRQLGV